MIYAWQAALWRRLMAQPARMPHALLLEGAIGIGKRDFALSLAAGRLCESPKTDGQPCGQCASCHWISQGSHPDLRILEPLSVDSDEEEGTSRKKAEIAIAQVRALSDFFNLSSHRAGTRVVLIQPAEALNPAAANALLKTLEEPSPNSLFLLITHQANFLLPTIKSRCHRIGMPHPDSKQSAQWLAQQGVDKAELCLALAGGAPLLARAFADKDYLQARQAFLGALQKPGQLNWPSLAEQGVKAELSNCFDWLQKWMADLVSAKLAGQVRYNLDFTNDLQDLARRVNVIYAQKYVAELAQLKRRLKHPLNPQLFMESVLLGYLAAVNDGRST